MSAGQFKIDSPYAKFGIGGQLTCTLCNCPVKSAKVWIAHINGRQHRESLAARNSKQQTQVPQPKKPAVPALTHDSKGVKRPAPTEKASVVIPEDPKRKKPSQNDVLKSPEPKIKDKDVKPQQVKVPKSNVSDDMDIDAERKPASAVSTDLPADFFDNSINITVSENKTETEAVESTSGVQVEPKSGELPEGFFDNRKLDAKARGVEMKDPLDDEWAKFQKEMQKVETVSELIIEEDEDKTTLERDLDEVEEQMREWSRINELEKKKDTIIDPSNHVSSNRQADTVMESSGDEIDDVNIDDVLDWRSKDVWK